MGEFLSWPFGKKQEKIKLTDSPESYESRVQKGEYLGILETYKVKWNLEKVARDTLQNFFDAQGETLGGVNFDLQGEQTEESTNQNLVISSQAEAFDYRKLLHLGGTSKETDETVGGFGEGAKIAALILLRDFNFSEVKYGSKDWELSFYFQGAEYPAACCAFRHAGKPI